MDSRENGSNRILNNEYDIRIESEEVNPLSRHWYIAMSKRCVDVVNDVRDENEMMFLWKSMT